MPGNNTTGGDIDDRLRADIAGQVARGSLSIQDACTRYQLSQESIVEWVGAFRHSSLMAFDEELRRTLADQGVDVSTLATAEFHGDLTDLTIADLVQTLTLGRRQGVITVAHAGQESRISVPPESRSLPARLPTPRCCLLASQRPCAPAGTPALTPRA